MWEHPVEQPVFFCFGADHSYRDRRSTEAGLQADTPVLVGYVEEADQVEGQARSAVCSLAEDLVELWVGLQSPIESAMRKARGSTKAGLLHRHPRSN